jgi:hypothetical protein
MVLIILEVFRSSSESYFRGGGCTELSCQSAASFNNKKEIILSFLISVLKLTGVVRKSTL